MRGTTRRTGDVRADHQIVRRIQEESERAVYVKKVKETQRTRNANEWEVTSSRHAQHKNTERTHRLMQSEAKQRLEQRRAALRELLEREDRAYEKELKAQQVTPEMRRKEMEEQACAWREEQQRENQRFADEQMGRKFRGECDCLRAVEGRATALLVNKERKAQVEEKERIRYEREQQERKFADEVQQTHAREQELINEEKRIGKEKIAETRHRLDNQMNELQNRREEANRLLEEERQLMREQYELEQREAEWREESKREAQRQRRNELDLYNRANREIRARRMAKEREEDTRMIQALMEHVRDESEAEQTKKLELRKQACKYRQYLQEQAQKDADNEAALDRLRQEHLDRAWAKQLDQWNKEQEARRKLMCEVHADRQRQIAVKLALIRQKKEEDLAERLRIEDEIERLKEFEKLQVMERREKAQANAESLRGQIEQQRQAKGNILQEKADERHSAAREEAEYQRRLQEHVPNPRQRFPRHRAEWYH